MSRWFALALLPGWFSLIACNDRIADPAPDPNPRSSFNLGVPVDGEPTYYSSGVNTTYYGGYDGYENPGAARTAVHTEEFVWSASTGFWDIRETFSPQYGPFGAEDASEPGVSQVVRTRSDIKSYDRAGQLIVQPDTTLALSPQVPDSPTPSRMPVAHFSTNKSTGFAGPTRDVAPPTFSGQSGVDRRFVTPAAARRSLEGLTRTAKRTGTNGSQITFEIARGGTRVVLRFDTVIGAVTRTITTSNDGVSSEAEYSYERVPGAFVLVQTVTSVRTPGSQPIRTLRRYSNHQIR